MTHGAPMGVWDGGWAGLNGESGFGWAGRSVSSMVSSVGACACWAGTNGAGLGCNGSVSGFCVGAPIALVCATLTSWPVGCWCVERVILRACSFKLAEDCFLMVKKVTD